MVKCFMAIFSTKEEESYTLYPTMCRLMNAFIA